MFNTKLYESSVAENALRRVHACVGDRAFVCPVPEQKCLTRRTKDSATSFLIVVLDLYKGLAEVYR